MIKKEEATNWIRKEEEIDKKQGQKQSVTNMKLMIQTNIKKFTPPGYD